MVIFGHYADICSSPRTHRIGRVDIWVTRPTVRCFFSRLSVVRRECSGGPKNKDTKCRHCVGVLPTIIRSDRDSTALLSTVLLVVCPARGKERGFEISR